jgi:hypothetical protein
MGGMGHPFCSVWFKVDNSLADVGAGARKAGVPDEYSPGRRCVRPVAAQRNGGPGTVVCRWHIRLLEEMAMTTCKAGGAGLLLESLLLAGAACTAVPAAAQVQSNVAVSNLRYEMVDLTPGDGQASSFMFTQADPSPMTISASVTPVAGSEQNDDDGLERLGYFEFSPHTQVSLALDVHIAMQAVPLPEPEQSGYAQVAFFAGATWGPPKGSWERRDLDYAYADIGLDALGRFHSEYASDKTLRVTFVNDSDFAALGDFRIQLITEAHAMAAPVPEAPAPAIGAGLLGMLGRRRRGGNRSADVATAC